MDDLALDAATLLGTVVRSHMPGRQFPPIIEQFIRETLTGERAAISANCRSGNVVTMSTAEAAKHLHRSERMIRYMIRDGHLKAEKVGGSYVVEVPDVA